MKPEESKGSLRSEKLVPKGFRKTISLILSIFLISILIIPVQGYFNLPSEQRIFVGDKLTLGLPFPDTFLERLSVKVDDANDILNLKEDVLNLMEMVPPVASEPGEVNLELKIFGFIPFKKINVNVVPNLSLYPGGQSVGVLLRTEGILIVGQSPIIDEKGNAHFPAKDVGIENGDIILKLNDHELMTDDQLARLINDYGKKNKKVILTLKRGNQIFTREVKPIYCQETETYRIGLFVRDNAGGVGTLTFYDPGSKIYGALGHMITDSYTNQQINIKNGKLVRASVEGIKVGKKGDPGEKIGMFVENSNLGSIEVNTFCGIFGKLSQNNIPNSYYTKPLPVGFVNSIETGPAEILTVVKGEKIEKFSINIEKVMPARRDGKGMVIRITDPALLEKTGGIIQGMSGSPIIQNGKLIGAVTHVFVNDPTRGYGIFIEDMLIEAGIITSKTSKNLGA